MKKALNNPKVFKKLFIFTNIFLIGVFLISNVFAQEKEVSTKNLEGIFIIVVIDYEDGTSKERHIIMDSSSGKETSIKFKKGIPKNLESGQSIRVTGNFEGKVFQVKTFQKINPVGTQKRKSVSD
jgi:hypothetical protein